MKKIIVGMFSLALLLVAHNASAAVWNGASNDCQGLSVANHTTNTGIIVPCWPLTSVSANGGDVVNLRIYYHNTSGLPATNVKVSLVAPTGASNAHSFSGQITSDQGSINLNTVRVNTPAGTTLNFSGAHWLPNQNQTESSLLYSQTGREILGGGLNIGTINSSWEAQGSVVVVFSVVGPTNPPSTTPTGTLIPNRTSCPISAGQNSCDINFSWSTTNPVGTSAVTRDGGSNVATGNSGSTAFNVPYGSTTFRLYNNALELDTETVTSYCTTGTSWNGSSCVASTTSTCLINNFTASNTSISSGNSSTLNWNTSNCSSVTINPTIGSASISGSQSVSPTASTSYVLTAYGSTGVSQTANVTIYVNNYINNSTCRIINFDADDTSVETGSSVRLEWSTENCSSVSISNVGSGLSRNGSYRIYPTYTRTYVLSAYGSNGSDDESVRVYVDDNNNNNGYNNTPSASTYTPTSVTNAGATLSGYTNGNGSLINSWIEFPCYGTKYGTRYNQYSLSMSIPVYSLSPNTTYNYCAVAQNVNNNQIYRGSSVSFRTTGQTYVEPVVYVNKNVVTTIATNVTRTEAQVNGYITNSSYSNSNTYFEYGTNVNLGTRTVSKNTTGNTSFSEMLTGLTPNTIYFFQAVSENANGISRGSIEIFKTLGATVARPAVVQGTTVVGTGSPLVLSITNKYQMIGEGDIVDYVVTYKNIGKVKLSKPVVQVVLPINMTLMNSSKGTYSIDTRTLSAQIEDLDKGQEGFINLQGRMDSMPLNNSQIVTTAIFVYTGANGAQENAMAYVFNTPKEGVTQSNVLGGSAFFAGLQTMGLLSWLFLIFIVLVIVLIARSYSNRVSGDNGIHTPTH